ncbi:MAG: bifunctional 2-C-methyl-D-erythritol 4-phosphate cytidylyltransferase/2-C-methyl-D-erythritol 2,4-cyclodiphosphate synthase [Hyphomicrobiaceae bacterium]|nr:bifunctional 2-C-methyl-D-erythritol 4-phosphate cytidylyltransferase/2-C-methyl-D-erythritol 2,4-cyclodiphosphate synthase [Hyphomicrobiaceae bacterium]
MRIAAASPVGYSTSQVDANLTIDGLPREHRTHPRRLAAPGAQVPVTTAALIVAAGRGTRAGGDLPKQYARLADRTVLALTVEAFGNLAEIEHIQVVIHPEDGALYASALALSACRILAPVHGGATRQLSVLNGLEALENANKGITEVLIHDAARPFVQPDTVRQVIAALKTHPGALAAIPLADTLKRAGPAGLVAETVPRAGLWRAQTPQGFRLGDILAAHRKAAATGRDDFTDDASIAEWAGIPVAIVEDTPLNFKITTPLDLRMADKLISAPNLSGWLPATGTGFDVHRFTDGDHVMLGGLKIPHTQGVDAHSDGDVVLHALTDALLGALGDGDIGQHFPPSNPKWKGAASYIFLQDAVARVASRGGRITNADVTVLCEAPKIGPHRDAMKTKIAEIMGLDPTRVGIKATTTEGLGFTGRREGIAAMASIMLLLPHNKPAA